MLNPPTGPNRSVETSNSEKKQAVSPSVNVSRGRPSLSQTATRRHRAAPSATWATCEMSRKALGGGQLSSSSALARGAASGSAAGAGDDGAPCSSREEGL